MEKHELDSRTADQIITDWRIVALNPPRTTWRERVLDYALVCMWLLAFGMLIFVLWRLG
jgi:hypothetical protein